MHKLTKSAFHYVQAYGWTDGPTLIIEKLRFYKPTIATGLIKKKNHISRAATINS